jgi:hypothetical protein
MNVGKMVVGEKAFLPCTPHGIIQLLIRSGVTIEGADVVIVGRSNIVGKPLANMLIQAEFNKIRPAIVEYIGARNKNKDDKEGELLTEELTYLWKNDRDALSSEFPEIFSSRSENAVPVREVTCPNCEIKKEPHRITLAPGQEVPKGGIFIVGEVYKCGNCGAEWGGRTRTSPQSPPSNPPIAKPPTSDVPSRPRLRTHGFGYTFQVGADRIDEKRRWYQRGVTDIVINAAHSDFKKFKEIAKDHKNSKILRSYHRQVAAEALVQLHYSDPLKYKPYDVVEKYQKLLAKILINFYTYSKDARSNETGNFDEIPIPEVKPEFRMPPPPSPVDKRAMIEKLGARWGATIKK